MRLPGAIWAWGLALLVGWQALHGLRMRPLHPEPGVLAADEPEQTPWPDAQVFSYAHDRYRVLPLAHFALTARVLGREDYRWDSAAALVPTDLALGWGRMSDTAVLRHIEIHQGGRFYFWSTTDFPIPRREIETHSANMHLIPPTAALRGALARVRVGEIVQLSGALVEVQARDGGWRLRSSLSRDDTGAGACEVIWLESLEHGPAAHLQ